MMDQEKRQDVDLSAVDEQGRRVYDETGEKIHWATGRERIIAWVLALIVIAITIAMAYSISTGDFFRH